MRALLLSLLVLTIPFAFALAAPTASATPVCPYGSSAACCPGPCRVPWPVQVVEECLKGDPACPIMVSTGQVCSELVEPTCNGYLVCVGSYCVIDPCWNAAVCQ